MYYSKSICIFALDGKDMSTIEEKLRKHAPATPSRWREKAEWRNQNKSWLRFSQLVAIRMLEKMDAEGLTQKVLAERLGCSQQYVSKILKVRGKSFY